MLGSVSSAQLPSESSLAYFCPTIADAWQSGRIDYILGNIFLVIQVDAFVKDHEVSGRTRACDIGWIEDRAVIADIVEKAGRDGRASRNKREKARKGVRVCGGARV